MAWQRVAPGLYRTADGAWKVERTVRGDGWHLYGPDPETGTEIYYDTCGTKSQAQSQAG